MTVWNRVIDTLPEPGQWVVVCEEDDAGFAYGLGEYVDGVFVSFAHDGIEPTHWIALPGPPAPVVGDLFAETVAEGWQ